MCITSMKSVCLSTVVYRKYSLGSNMLFLLKSYDIRRKKSISIRAHTYSYFNGFAFALLYKTCISI